MLPTAQPAFSQLDLPSLSLASSIQIQRKHERTGALVRLASLHGVDFAARASAAAMASGLDVSKAQDQGHTSQLVSGLAQATIHHLLFAKGQLTEPVSQLQRRAAAAAAASAGQGRRPLRAKGSAKRRETKMLRRLEALRQHLLDAAHALCSLDKGEGTSAAGARNILQPADFQLLFVLGRTVTSPKDMFVVSLKDALLPPGDDQDNLSDLLSHWDGELDQHHYECASQFLDHASEQVRERAREKTCGVLERKLVRFMVGDDRVEGGLGAVREYLFLLFLSRAACSFSFPRSTLLPISLTAPTKTRIFLLAPKRFSSPGWIPRQHLRFCLDALHKSKNETLENDKDTDQDSESQDPQSSQVPVSAAEGLHAGAHGQVADRGEPAISTDCRPPASPRIVHQASWSSNSTQSRTNSTNEDTSSDTAADTSMSSMLGSDENVTEELKLLSEALSPVKRQSSLLGGNRKRLSIGTGTPRAGRLNPFGSALASQGVSTPQTVKAPRTLLARPSSLRRPALQSRPSLGTPTVARQMAGFAESLAAVAPVSMMPPRTESVSLDMSQALSQTSELSPSLKPGSLPSLDLPPVASSLVGRRSKPPRPGSLLERQLIKRSSSANQVSEKRDGLTRSRVGGGRQRRLPRCAGLELDFSTASDEQLAEADPGSVSDKREGDEELIWFMCEAVLEGYR